MGDLDHGGGDFGGVGARLARLGGLEDLGDLGALCGLEGGGLAGSGLGHTCSVWLVRCLYVRGDGKSIA